MELFPVNCSICNGPTEKFGDATVRGKYRAEYDRCTRCGFIQALNPHWLAESYLEPINRSDTGYVMRNLWARDKTCHLIESFLNPDGIFLDHAAGYGLFVRLMRDCGYDFRWADLYCPNLFCRGFEAPLPLRGPYEAVTAFEVLEHLTNPKEEIQKLLTLTSCLIFSTALLPQPAPALGQWWYYGLEHGQHIAFYTRQSLEHLAQQSGYHLASNGADLHIFSRTKIPAKILTPPKSSRWHFWDKPRPRRISLTGPDYQVISGVERCGTGNNP